MKNIILKILFILLIAPLSYGAGTCWNGGSSGTTPWSVLDGDGGSPSVAYADVNYCVNTVASAGDTVILPEGEAIWASQLYIRKAMILQGQTVCSGDPEDPITCVDGTVITTNLSTGNYLIRVEPTDSSLNPSIDVSGITFVGGSGEDKGNLLYLYCAPNETCTQYRIHGNSFRNYSVPSTAITSRGNTFGLIDENRFDRINTGNYVYEMNIRGDHGRTWTDHPTNTDPTSSDSTSGGNFLYIERNSFLGVGYIWNDAGEGCRYMVRHNALELDDSNLSTFINVHGDTNNRGCVAWGMYENTSLGNGTDTYRTALIQGGNGVFYNNELNGGGTIDVMEQYLACTYETDGCAGGYDDRDGINNTYIWNNTKESSAVLPVQPEQQISYVSGGTHEIIAADDLTGDASGAWGGLEFAPSVTSGTWAGGDAAGKIAMYKQRYPAFISGENISVEGGQANVATLTSGSQVTEKIEYWDDVTNVADYGGEYFTKDVAANRDLETCTIGDVYWETDDEELYRCTDTDTWTWVYSPYTYPHPLAGPDETSPTISSVMVNGTVVTVTWDEGVVTTAYNADLNMDCSTAGANIALSSPTGTGATRTLTSATPVAFGDTCNIDVVGTHITDAAETPNAMETVNDIAVTNNTADVAKQSGRMSVGGIGGSTPGRNTVTIPGSTPGRMGVITH